MFISAQGGEDEGGTAAAINISFSSSVTNKSRRRNKLIDWLGSVSLSFSLSMSVSVCLADPGLVRRITRRPSPNCHDVQLSDVLKTGGTNFFQTMFVLSFAFYWSVHP